MKTIKTMSIIGLCVAGFSWFCMAVFMNPVDYESSVGWGFINLFYTIALCIVGIVQSKK